MPQLVVDPRLPSSLKFDCSSVVQKHAPKIVEPAGIGTSPDECSLVVAGFHRASPSTTLDKSITPMRFFVGVNISEEIGPCQHLHSVRNVLRT